MPAPVSARADKPQVGLIVAVIDVILAIVLVVGVGYHELAPSSPSLAQQFDLDKHPIPAWVTQDAQQCQGDITKLSPTEQQRLAQAYPGQGARIIIMAAYAQSR